MANNWKTIVPLRNLWEVPQALPFYLGNGISIARIPDELKLEDANDLLRDRLIEAIDDAEYCFLVEYQADALDESQPQAELRVCFAYIALWLVKGTEMYMDTICHIHEIEDCFVTRWISDLDRFYCNPSARDVELSESDFNDSVKLFKALDALPTATNVYTALKFLVRALKLEEWDWRFVCFWVSMEALFGTSSEINFRLSQRVGLFLGNTPDDAKAIARIIKDSYGYRSKVVHGALITNLGEKESLVVMNDLEHYLRQALVKIITNERLLDTFQNKVRDSYLDELVYTKVFN